MSDKLRGRILSWVDSDIGEIDSLLNGLKSEGLQVSPYFTFEDAVNAIDEIAKSNILLLDLNLGWLSPEQAERITSGKEDLLGIQLLNRLQRERILNLLPIVVFSTAVQPVFRTNISKVESFTAHHLSKPVKPSVLHQVICQAAGWNIGK